jgi:outer membrane protein
MKNLKTLLLIAVITLSFNTTAKAQSKVAHINIQELIASIPEVKTMREEFTKLEKTYIDDIQAESAAFKTKYDRYQAEAAGQTPEENERRGLEIEQFQKRLQTMQQLAQKELGAKEKEVGEKMNPFLVKVDAAVKAVAKAQGFDYVLDSSVLLVANGTNLLAAAKTQLGI